MHPSSLWHIFKLHRWPEYIFWLKSMRYVSQWAPIMVVKQLLTYQKMGGFISFCVLLLGKKNILPTNEKLNSGYLCGFKKILTLVGIHWAKPKTRLTISNLVAKFMLILDQVAFAQLLHYQMKEKKALLQFRARARAFSLILLHSFVRYINFPNVSWQWMASNIH